MSRPPFPARSPTPTTYGAPMTASTVLAARPAPRGRGANVALWVVQVLLAAMFGFAGINKLLGLQPEMIAQFARIGAGQWFRYLTGALELAGAIGLLVPRLSGLAALGLAGVMVGAVITHLTVLPPHMFALLPGTLAIVLLVIARGRWNR